MFCAIATTIDRCKSESVVDVFQVVKAQRNQKPGLVLTVVSIIVSPFSLLSLSPFTMLISIFTYLVSSRYMQEQYQFVFEAVLTFLETFDMYSNFKWFATVIVYFYQECHAIIKSCSVTLLYVYKLCVINTYIRIVVQVNVYSCENISLITTIIVTT